MIITLKVLFISVAAVLLLAACDEKPAIGVSMDTASTQIHSKHEDKVNRMYDKEQLARGEMVYRDNCAACHGVNAQGVFNWKKVDANGNYPAPPLNGTGHAWHHSNKVLRQVILNGSPGGQGNMPAWKDRLTDQQIDDVIVWFQSKWSPKIYSAWLKRNQSSGFKRINSN